MTSYATAPNLGPDTTELRIGVVGAGAIGCLLAARLTQYGRAATLLGRRPSALDLISQNGIEISGHDAGIFPVETLILPCTAPVARFDVLFLCIKSWDTTLSTEQVSGLLTETGIVVSLQNGLNDKRVADCVGADRTGGGILRMPARLLEAYRVEALSRHPAVVLGAYTDRLSLPVESIRELLKPFAETSLTANLNGHRWSKMADNCTGNPLLALTGLTLDRFLASQSGRRIAYGVIRELLDTAAFENVDVEDIFGLPADIWGSKAVEDHRLCGETLQQLGREKVGLRSSMASDINAGKRTEIDFLNGEIWGRGRFHGIATPLNQRIVELVHELEAKNRGVSTDILEELQAYVQAEHRL